MSDPNANLGGSGGGYYESSGEDGADYSSTSRRYNDYSSHRGTYGARGYHRGSRQGRFNSYSGPEMSEQELPGGYADYHGGQNYRNDYYYGGRGEANRYYGGRESSSHNHYGHNNQRYNHSYQAEHQYHYYNSRRDSDTQRGGRYGTNFSPRFKSSSKPYAVQDGQTNSPHSYDSGNSTPVEQFNRSLSQSNPPSAISAAHSSVVRTGSIPSVRRRVDKNESCFYYLTDLDKSTDDPKELERIREILREGDILDQTLEKHNFQLLKTELELELLTSQCERDALNVQLTQEKLDSLLMQG